MLAIAVACNDGLIKASVDMVISNRPEAAGLTAARNLGLQTQVVDHTRFPDRSTFETAISERLSTIQPDWIVLAGFMRILTAEFVDRWSGRILNIHPSLLPLYPGLDTHRRAIEAGDSHAGATVHIVTTELDAGPVIAQVRVPIHVDDTPESLSRRVLAEEHGLYIKALQQCVNRGNA